MENKFFVHYSGTKEAFVAAGYPATYTNKIVFISGTEEGKGACIYTHGKYYGDVAELVADVNNIKSDYLKAADKTELVGLINAAKNELTGAIATAKAEVIGTSEDTKDSLTIEGVRKYVEDKTSGIASEGTVSALANRVKAIEDDYLVEADKEELAGNIQTNAANIKTNTDAIAVLNGNAQTAGSVDQKVADAINDFATKVSDNQTVDTFKELIDYAATHGSEFAELVGEVDANTKAIETLNGGVEVAGSVDKKVADAIAAEISRSDDAYDAKGAAAAAETAAKGYADTEIADAIEAEVSRANGAYDPKGSAAQALVDAKAYVDAMFVWEEL